MATTNVDIVKVSELTSIERLTDNDRFIVNDHNPDDGTVVTKTILGTDLAEDFAGRITLGDLAGVEIADASIGDVLKFDGTNWVPAVDIVGDGGSGGVQLTSLSAVVLSPVLGQNGNLSYNQYQGIFTYTQPDLRIANLDDVVDQVPTTGQFLRWGGSFWYPSGIDEQSLIVENSTVNAGEGSLSLEGDVLTYTPPDFSPYLTEEIDPIFSQSAAASLTYETLAQLQELLLPQEELAFGDLRDVNFNGVQTRTGMSVYFDEETQIWTAQFPKPGKLGDLEDVYTDSAESGDIIIYDGAQWRAQPNPKGSVEAGDGLVGGGVGDIVLHVLPGVGIGIRDDAVTLTADLGNLQNVNVSGASVGDALTYLGGNTWASRNPGLLGPQVLNDLNDCNVPGPANGQYLRYQNGVWVAQAAEELDAGVTSVNAGLGLTGGGTGAVTVNVGAGSGIGVTSNTVFAKIATGLALNAANSIILDANLNHLNNVQGTPQTGEVLTWTGSYWEPVEPEDLPEINIPDVEVTVSSKDSGGGVHYPVFVDSTLDSDNQNADLLESQWLQWTPGQKKLELSNGGSLHVTNTNDDGIRAYSSGRLEITDINGLPQVTFRDSYDGSTGYDFRIRQQGVQLQMHSENKRLLMLKDDKAVIGEECNDPVDLKVNGDIEMCGQLSQVGLPQYPMIGVRMWIKVERENSGSGSSDEGWTIKGVSKDPQGNPHISLDDTSGYGIVRLNFLYPIEQDAFGNQINNDYCVTVTGWDDENDHMYGVKDQTKQNVTVYSKDIENYDRCTGGCTNEADRCKGFYVAIIF